MTVVRFQEKGRAKLAKVLAVVHWVCIIPSFICLIAALFIQISIEDKIFFIENYNGAILPGILVFTGFFGLFTHILCGKVCFANRRVDKRRKWSMFLIPVVIVTFIIFVSELVSGIMCFVHISDLGESFDTGIKVAMAAYRDDVSTKEEMDVLQMTYDCCGSRGFKDWFFISWIHSDYISESKQNGRHSDLGDEFHFDDVPFSCCNPAVLRPCIYHHVLDNDLHFNYDYRTETTLHTKGCTDRLMEYYENSVLKLMGILVLSLSFLQLFNMVACRYLQTAVQNAAGSDDPTGPSWGYLIKTGKAKETGLNDTTMTTNETSAMLDTTDTTEDGFDDSFDNEERYTEIFNKEPFYENVPPFQTVEYTQPYADDIDDGHGQVVDDEHIYNEGEVEDYLANKYASSKERFEQNQDDTGSYQAMGFAPPPPLDQEVILDDEQGEEPIYTLPPPPKSRSSLGKMGSRLRTSGSRAERSAASLMHNNSNYMSMNISNSSVKQETTEPGRRNLVRTHQSSSPQRSLNDSQPYIINIKSYKSPSSPVSPLIIPRRIYSPRKRAETRRSFPPTAPRDRYAAQHPQRPRLIQRPRLSESPTRQQHRPEGPYARDTCIGLHSPRRRFRSSSAFSPYMYNFCNKSRSPGSPGKSRSPEKVRMLEKVEYRSGGSYGCHHSAQ